MKTMEELKLENAELKGINRKYCRACLRAWTKQVSVKEG
jgi:hypothetical protein